MSKLLEFALVPLFFFCIMLYQCSELEHHVAQDKIKKQEKQYQTNQFNFTLDTIRHFIFKQEYSLAEDRIQELRNTSTQSYQKNQINEVENLLIDHRTYMNICKTWSYSNCVEYLNNPKLFRYSERVQEIQFKIIDKDYQLCSKKNNIASWKYFLEKYPSNPYEYQVRNSISELEFEIENRKAKKIESNHTQTHQPQQYVKPTIYSPGYFSHNNHSYNNQLNISSLSSRPTYSYNNTYNAPNSYNYPSTYVPNTYVNPNANPNTVYVRGYTRKDGTVVRPHIRTAPNSTKADNLRYR